MFKYRKTRLFRKSRVFQKGLKPLISIPCEHLAFSRKAILDHRSGRSPDSWLSAHPQPSRVIKNPVTFGAAPHLQWPDRPGFTPGSLFTPDITGGTCTSYLIKCILTSFSCFVHYSFFATLSNTFSPSCPPACSSMLFQLSFFVFFNNYHPFKKIKGVFQYIGVSFRLLPFRLFHKNILLPIDAAPSNVV